ncbi:hypothetical protein FN846DRAFT_894477 [Sphaerosporella brunnea]|uniref:RNase H type-1 domain-containing protein n=1 Tax=Sphaerosporella brunnea TaxID=1250544 RepID=A0A5J5EK42_9PEZI|nr:hypothetical protein FN846DRAFT_894477 [Sphaerosporella brunnea]
MAPSGLIEIEHQHIKHRHLPGNNRKQALEKLWKGPKTLADHLWDAATDPIREDIPTADADRLPPGRGRPRSPIIVEATTMLWTRSSLKGRVIVENTESAKATAEAWTDNPNKGIAVFTDGSKVEDGWTGCVALWNLWHWQGRKMSMDCNKEVFDAELYAIWIRLVAARYHNDGWAAVAGRPKAISILW